MVAHLLGLRLLLLKNTLLRSTWQLVAVILGGLYGLGMLISAVLGLFALSMAPIESARVVVVCAGSAVILGWIILPLAITGLDQSLDSARLAPFPIKLNTLLLGLAVCGVVGIPGIITLLISVATAGTWWRNPAIAAIALLCGLIATMTCIVGSRAVTALSVTLTSGRRFREVAGLLVFVPAVLLGPIIISVGNGIGQSLDALPAIAQSLSWTPIGAVWAGGSDEMAPDDLHAAIIFAANGALLPKALGDVAKGGSVVCAGIHMSDIPAFPYALLWGERSVRSVANLTRADGEAFFRIAAELPLRTRTTAFALRDAQKALDALRAGDFDGAAVLRCQD